MWSLVGGPYLAAAGLLVLAGAPKLKDPMPLVRALRSVRLPASRGVVRALAGVEIAVGLAAVLHVGRATAAAVCLSYLAFSAFVAMVLLRGGVLGSCGCFGRPDTPATPAHLAVTVVLAAAAAALVASPPEHVWSASAQVVVLVGFAALIAWLAYLVMAVLPTTTPAAVRSAAPTTTSSRRG
jgi:hypothetical protein